MTINEGFTRDSEAITFTFEYKDDAKLMILDKDGKPTLEFTMEDFLNFLDTRTYLYEKTTVLANGRDNVIDHFAERHAGFNYDLCRRLEAEELVRKLKRRKNEMAVVRISYGDELSRRLFEYFRQTKQLKLVGLDETEE